MKNIKIRDGDHKFLWNMKLSERMKKMADAVSLLIQKFKNDLQENDTPTNIERNQI